MKHSPAFFRFPKAILLAAIGCALPLTLLAITAPQRVEAASGDLAAAAAALRSISTLTANFTQTDRQGRVMSGKLTLKRPGKIRFQYEKSVPMLIVSDGKSLSVVDYQVKQVQRWPIVNSPLGVLLDPTRDVTRYGKQIDAGNANVIAVEVKDPKRPEYGRITLVFIRKAGAPGGLELANWVALDSQNNRTTVRLSNHAYGVSVADSAFTYRDPRVTTKRPGK